MSQDLFKTINATIREERLYADIDYGMSFPQYINAIRMEEAYILLTDHPEMTIAEVARQVGFTAPNLREQFKRCYGITPVEYRAGLVSDVDV